MTGGPGGGGGARVPVETEFGNRELHDLRSSCVRLMSNSPGLLPESCWAFC